MFAEYDECVAGFEKIDAARGEQLISGDGEAVIYIGKAVCPFCRRFVKKLQKSGRRNARTYLLYRQRR